MLGRYEAGRQRFEIVDGNHEFPLQPKVHDLPYPVVVIQDCRKIIFCLEDNWFGEDSLQLLV